jgi:hypothetical protein
LTADTYGLERGDHDVCVQADSPEHPLTERALHIGSGRGVATGRERVLGIVKDAHVHVESGKRRHERSDRAVADALERELLTAVGERTEIVSAPSTV